MPATSPTVAWRSWRTARTSRVNVFVKWLWIGSSASKVTSVEVSDAAIDAAAGARGISRALK